MRIGVDLGGTKIEIIALADDGRVLLRQRVPAPHGDYAGTVQTIAALVADTVRSIERAGLGGDVAGHPLPVGVGIPGTESGCRELIKNANSTWLIGKPLRHDLETAMGRPVRLANDANCFAMSEACDGAARDARCAFGVILGTGVGGGIVFDRHLVSGANGIAGEWGHNCLPPDSLDGELGSTEPPRCYCGRRGCIETYLSGPALEADGGVRSEAAMQRYERRLARALAGVINILDPDVIVLGGGVSNIERLYATVPQLWGEYIFSDTVATRLVRNMHGDSSGVRGAAWLWP